MEPKIETCEDALRMLAAHLDGELSSEVRSGMERHLSICRACYSRAEFEKRLKARLADGSADVPDGLRDRVETMIRRFAVTSSESRPGN